MTDPRVIHGDMREVLGRMIAEGQVVQSIVTDPPYHLTAQGKSGRSNLEQPSDKDLTKVNAGSFRRLAGGFMGKVWDGGDIAFQPGTWRLCFELLPPGGHLLAFAGTRTYHRMAVAIEEAGFEIRDTIAWLYGSGFPKSHNVSKAIDRAAGAEQQVVGFDGIKRAADGQNRKAYGDFAGNDGTITAPATDAARQWEGWGTALKPAMELICVARKPLVGTVAANVLKHGTGALNIDGCRVSAEGEIIAQSGEKVDMARAAIHAGYDRPNATMFRTGKPKERGGPAEILGRWPANVCHDGSDEVVSAFPDSQSGIAVTRNGGGRLIGGNGIYGGSNPHDGVPDSGYADSGSAARFFYSSKADADDRLGSKHPTVKPVDLMRWLVRLVTPPGGTVLDPFAGSGTTGMACMAEGFDCILIEREAEYVADIKARIAHVRGDDTPLFAVAAE